MRPNFNDYNGYKDTYNKEIKRISFTFHTRKEA